MASSCRVSEGRRRGSGQLRGMRLQVAAMVAAAALASTAASAQDRPLRIVLGQELAVLDPIISTNNATRAFGYMVFDTLIAMDGSGAYQPQMLQSWSASEGHLTWTFKLRPGLEWHDGAPVTAEDCVASIRRWGARDGLGQLMMAATKEMRVLDANTFAIELSRPFGFVVEALGKPGTIVPFMMPARLAATDPARPVPEIIGSGPWTFRREEWRQGDRAVFRRNQRYRPREEPADGLAGGKAVHFETAEFVSITDTATRAAALQGGEVDVLEIVPPDFVPLLRRNRGVVVTRPKGGIGQNMPFISLNHAQPPFDDPAIRRAAQAAIGQAEIMAGTGLPDDLFLPECLTIYACDSPASTDAGTEGLRRRGGGPERARELLRAAGYKGERMVFLHPSDSAILHPVAAVAVEQLRRAGFNVDEWTSDWASVAQRRLSREPVERGGWSAVTVIWPGIDLFNPMVNSVTAYNCRNYPGWFCDTDMKALLERYAAEGDPAQRRGLEADIQRRFHGNVNFVIAGQLSMPQAYRADLRGAVDFAFPVSWNLRRSGR